MAEPPEAQRWPWGALSRQLSRDGNFVCRWPQGTSSGRGCDLLQPQTWDPSWRVPVTAVWSVMGAPAGDTCVWAEGR